MNNPLDRAKEAGMKRAIKQIDPKEHPLVRSIAAIISQLEHDQAVAIARNVDAADLDIPVRHDVEDRRDELLEVADAIANQDLKQLWFEDLADIENHALAMEYVGMNGDEWREQIEEWYGKYRELGVVEQPVETAERADVGHIAAMHVEDMFGVELSDFVAGVVNWEQGEALEHLLAGNIQSFTRVMHQIADEMDRREQRIEELEERIAELEGPDDAE